MAEVKDVVSTAFTMLGALSGMGGDWETEKKCSQRILELASMLDKEQIPYEKRNLFGEIDQLYFDWCRADVVCHIGSYGGPRGLFEAMGEALLTKKELKEDEVIGCLSIEDTFERIKKAWSNSKKEKA
jgi:hypothetical protein